MPSRVDAAVTGRGRRDRRALLGTARRRRADWEAVERDFRTGTFTLRELETQHGVSASAISRKAHKNQWSQDLRAVIKQATQEALLRENATATQQENADLRSPSVIATVLAAAELNKQVILGHRQEIQQLRDAALKGVALIGRQVDAMLRAADAATGQPGTSLPDPGGVLLSAQRASQTLGRLQAMERRAFGLDEEEDSACAEQGAQRQLSDAARAARIAKLLELAERQPAPAAPGAPDARAA